MKSFKEFLSDSTNLEEAKLDVKVLFDKKASDAKDGRYWQQFHNKDENVIFPKLHDGVLYFDVWRTPNYENPRSRPSSVKVFRKKNNKWIDNNTNKDASKYLNDLFWILEREFNGDTFF